MRPSDLNRLGVSRTFQLLQVFPQLSVRENLILAGQEHKGTMLSRLFGRRDAGLGPAADRMIGVLQARSSRRQLAGGLSYGQQKLLDAAMAFMAGPRLVLLDEPAGGVNLTMLADLKERLRAINREQRRDLRRDRAQYGIRHVAVHAGHRAGARQGARRRARPMRCAPIRPSSKPISAIEDAAMNDPILRVEALVGGYGKMTILNGASFAAPRGAITTVIGPNGAGKSTVFKAVFGLLKLRSGRILFDGRTSAPRRAN
jgi:ABC-type branched-subunit amino acid transport system ATPase component